MPILVKTRFRFIAMAILAALAVTLAVALPGVSADVGGDKNREAAHGQEQEAPPIPEKAGLSYPNLGSHPHWSEPRPPGRVILHRSATSVPGPYRPLSSPPMAIQPASLNLFAGFGLKDHAERRATVPNDIWGYGLAQLPARDTTAANVPGAPTGLTATASGPTQIDLSWTAPASDGGAAITGYRIEVSTDGSAWSDLVADTNSAGTAYSHAGLTSGDTRHYRVSAINSAGTGPASNVATATAVDPLVARYDASGNGTIEIGELFSAIEDYFAGRISISQLFAIIELYFGGSTPPATAQPPGAPTGLTATVTGPTGIDLSWNAPASDGGAAITGYRIEVSTDGSAWTDLAADTNSAGTAYSHAGLTSGDTRHYRVSAINSAGTGPASNVATAATAQASDLVVESPGVDNSSPAAGASFTLSVTVRNQGAGRSGSTTLRYYRSTNSSIFTGDTEVGTDSVSGLSASRSGDESISLTAPSTPGPYYYGACVDAVSGESDTGNNCSSAVAVTVGAAPARGLEAAHAALSQLLPWYDDPPYPLAVVPFVEVWLRDPDLGRDLAQAPWVIDGITAPLEHNSPYGLGNLYDRDPALARRMLAYSTEEPVRTRNIHILNVLGDMARDDPASLELLLAEEWFADGLSPEERAFVIVLEKVAYHDTLYADLLAERFTLKTAIDLPLSGETVLWAFGHDAVEGNVLEAMEHGARAAERVMASQLPVTDLIMLQVNPERYGGGFGGVNRSDSMVLSTGSGWPDTAHAELLYHEIAHYYLAHEIGPFWLVEGGANFVRAYRQAWDGTEGWVGEVALFEGNEYAGRQWCLDNGVANVSALADAGAEFAGPCSYHLGQYLLTNLYNTIGEAAFSSSMAELYRSYRRFEFYPSEEEVYQVFLKHTPPDREEGFLDVYRRFHGGPFIDGLL